MVSLFFSCFLAQELRNFVKERKVFACGKMHVLNITVAEYMSH